MSGPPSPTSGEPPPPVGHPRPPLSPEGCLTPAISTHLNPGTTLSLPPPCPGTPLPELRPALAGVAVFPSAKPPCQTSFAVSTSLPELRPSLAGVGPLLFVPSFEGLDMSSLVPLANDEDEVEIPNYGSGFMATGGSFGKTTSLEMIQGRQHLLNVGSELMKIKLGREMEVGSDDDTPSLEFCDDDDCKEDGKLEEGELKEDNSLLKDEAFRSLMNGALKELRQEQDEIRQVDAILGQEERERARKGKLAIPASSPDSGKPFLAGKGPLPRGHMVARGRPLLAAPHEQLEGKGASKSKMSSSPITSISLNSITSSSPSKNSNSNHFKTHIPSSSCFPPLMAEYSAKRPSHKPTEPIGQPLTGQTLTNTKNFPSSVLDPTIAPSTAKPYSHHAEPSNRPPPRSKVSSTPWIDLVRASSSRMELTFVAPSRNDKGALVLADGTSKEGERFWKNTLVGYSMDRRLPFKLVQQRILSLWSKFGIQEIRVNKEGFFFFTFHSEQGANSVLVGGPWIVLGQQLVLKMWKRNFDFCKEEFKSVPNWVKLYGIPTTYWSSSGLSAIASHLGVPLYADELTSSAKLLEFARICVDMKVGSSFPTSFKVTSEFHEEFEVRVEYSWRPRQCTHCNVFGHTTQSCPNQPRKNPPSQLKKVYKPKSKPSEIVGPSSGISTHENKFASLGDEVVGEVLPSGGGSVDSPCLELVVMEESSEALVNPCGASGEKEAFCGAKGVDGLIMAASSGGSRDEGTCGDKGDNGLIMAASSGGLHTLELRGDNGLSLAATQGACALEDVILASPLAISMCEDSIGSPISEGSSPLLWGHKVKMVDELDRKKKKNLKRSEQRRKKWSKSTATDSTSKGLHGASASPTSS